MARYGAALESPVSLFRGPVVMSKKEKMFAKNLSQNLPGAREMNFCFFNEKSSEEHSQSAT